MEASWSVLDNNRIRCHSYQMSFEKKGQVQTPCWLAELGGVGQGILQAHV